MNETYECLQDGCRFKFDGPIGSVVCPKCGSIWVKWLTYEQWEDRRKQ